MMKKAMLFFILLAANCGVCNTISKETLEDKMRGMWLGQLIANTAGRPYEGKYQSSPMPDACDPVPWVILQEWGADDDTDIEYIAMHTLEANGLDCNSFDIAAQWQKHITSSGIYISNRQAWYLMGDGFVSPDTGSRTYNMHWYSIDSLITTESLGAVSPGMVQAAIDLTGKFAHASNEGFPVHAAQLYAAMYAEAFFEPNVVDLVNAGLEAIPTTSRTYEVASDILSWYVEDVNDGDPNWRDTRLKLRNKYYSGSSFGRYYNWIESTVNTGATILAVLYGEGDFKRTAQIGILAGWDNDCNPATAAGLIGVIDGYSGLPADLTNPAICGDVYVNVYRPYLPDHNLYRPQYDTVTNIASRLADIAIENIIENGGWQDSVDSNLYHIPVAGVLVTEPEKPDPNGPSGLVADAISAGVTVTTSAAVEYHNASYDRYNLDAIINGIKDNSYNGHRPYYSYTSNLALRPERDWYQINFSEPVKFDGVTFYEGDIVWTGINTYYKTDEARGGFFNDLTVEILRDGEYITPANLQMSPELNRYKMYQVISFAFAPTVGDAIRIIGEPGGTYGYTTIIELEASGEVDPNLYVASVVIAEQSVQRSDVENIEIKFSHDVTISKSDMTIAGSTNGTVVDMNDVGFNYDSSTRWLSLSFSSQLKDDSYDLKLDCSAIVDANGTFLLDDDSDPADGFYIIEFHDLFGDADGDADVDLYDLSIFAVYWFNSAADSGLDGNGDSVIDFDDLTELCKNWLVAF